MGGGGAVGLGSRAPQHTYLKMTPSSHWEHTYVGAFKTTITPWGSGPVSAAGFGGGAGWGRSGVHRHFMSGIHFWIPHDILSIWSIHTWGGNENVPAFRNAHRRERTREFSKIVRCLNNSKSVGVEGGGGSGWRGFGRGGDPLHVPPLPVLR